MKGGLSSRMSCSRIGYDITLRNPFDYDFKASPADTLSMIVEEFLMPTSVQILGEFSITTWDERAGIIRPIDRLIFSKLTT